jgi:type I restriction enzyme, S subunit
VSRFSTSPMDSLIDANRRTKQVANDHEVWNLNLDQIEPHSGRVLSKHFVNASEIGPSTYAFDKGTVLYSKLRPYLNKVVVADAPGMATTELVPLRCNEALVTPIYLGHFLRSPTFLSFATNVVAGAKMPRMVMGEFWRYPVPVPPIPEQRRIAAILDQAETLRTQRRTALALLDTLTQSIFLDMFGDPVTNPKAWPLVRLAEMGSLDRGVSKHRPRNAPELLNGPYPLVQTGEVSNCDGYIRAYKNSYSEIGRRQSKMWPAGTLLITIAANIAKTAILTFEACFPDSVVGFRADDPATVEFVRVWLSFLQKALEDAAPESAQKNINLAILRDLRIPAPSLALQQSFATRIQAVEALKSTHRAALAQLDALFASLQHRAFSGIL